MNKTNMVSSQRADAEALWMIRSAVLACAEGGFVNPLFPQIIIPVITGTILITIWDSKKINKWAVFSTSKTLWSYFWKRNTSRKFQYIKLRNALVL